MISLNVIASSQRRGIHFGVLGIGNLTAPKFACDHQTTVTRSIMKPSHSRRVARVVWFRSKHCSQKNNAMNSPTVAMKKGSTVSLNFCQSTTFSFREVEQGEPGLP